MTLMALSGGATSAAGYRRCVAVVRDLRSKPDRRVLFARYLGHWRHDDL